MPRMEAYSRKAGIKGARSVNEKWWYSGQGRSASTSWPLPSVQRILLGAGFRGAKVWWAQPTSRLEISASGQPRHSGGAAVSLSQVAVAPAAGKDSRPFLLLRGYTAEMTLVSTREPRCSFSKQGICPPAINNPTSIFLSIAEPVRFALVMKQMLPSATATFACTRPSENSSALSRHA